MLCARLTESTYMDCKCALPTNYWEREDPLKSFDPQSLRVGKGVEGCLPLNWSAGIRISKTCRLQNVGGIEHAVVPQKRLASWFSRESFSSDHRNWSYIRGLEPAQNESSLWSWLEWSEFLAYLLTLFVQCILCNASETQNILLMKCLHELWPISEKSGYHFLASNGFSFCPTQWSHCSFLDLCQ